MKFLVDENIGNSIIRYLRAEGYNIISIRESRPGMSDLGIMKLAFKEKRVIITYDQDFGELVFARNQKHWGIILIRVSKDAVYLHLRALKKFLSFHPPKEIVGGFHKVGDQYL